MYRLYSLLILAYFCFNLAAQSGIQMLEDSSLAYTWDTTANAWENRLRTLYSHDLNTNISTRTQYKWSYASEWRLDELWEITYDAKRNPVRENVFHWNVRTGLWDDYAYNLYAYDANGRQTDYAVHPWNPIEKRWEGWKRFTSVFKDNGDPLAHVTYHWNNPTKGWMGERKNIFKYDTCEILYSEDEYIFWGEPLSWVILNSYLHEHDSAGNITERIGYDRLPDSLAVLPTSRAIYIYDSTGNRVEIINYDWKEETNNWAEDYRVEYTYDSESRNTRVVRYGWDPSNNSWKMSSTEYSTYDTFSNLTDYVYYSCRRGGDCDYRQRYAHKYNSDGYLTQTIWYNWDSQTRDWVYDNKFLHFWSEAPGLSSNELSETDFLIYPNPFTDQFTIELPNANTIHKIELVNIHGMIVRSFDNAERTTLTIQRNNLPAGIYFIRIQSSDIFTGTVIAR